LIFTSLIVNLKTFIYIIYTNIKLNIVQYRIIPLLKKLINKVTYDNIIITCFNIKLNSSFILIYLPKIYSCIINTVWIIGSQTFYCLKTKILPTLWNIYIKNISVQKYSIIVFLCLLLWCDPKSIWVRQNNAYTNIRNSSLSCYIYVYANLLLWNVLYLIKTLDIYIISITFYEIVWFPLVKFTPIKKD